MRKEADDIGPAAELDHWKQRMAKFSALLDEIKTPRVIQLIYYNFQCFIIEHLCLGPNSCRCFACS